MEARRKAEEEERMRQDEENKKINAALQVSLFSSGQPTCVVTPIWCCCMNEIILFLAAAGDVHFFQLWALSKGLFTS